MSALDICKRHAAQVCPEQARELRDEGMQIATAHADEATPGWSDIAYRFLQSYCRAHEQFISEDVSDASKAWGMSQPPTDRAWGSIYRRAIKESMIVQDGAGRSRRRHASICPMWKSLLYRGAA